jgi:hypothetical protein
VSELTATRVPVLPGTDVRDLRTGKPCRVLGPIRHAGTGQEGVAVEGPEPGIYTYHTLEAFARLFSVEVPPGRIPRAGGVRGVPPPVPEKAAGHFAQGGGF